MVRIRLSRTGRRGYATYRVVVTPRREKRESRAIEQLGHYNPHTKEIVINADRAKYWLSVGAQPSETVNRLLIKEKIVEAPKKADKKVFNKEAGRKSKERAEAKAAKAEAAKAPKEEPKAEVEVTEEAPAEEKAAE